VLVHTLEKVTRLIILRAVRKKNSKVFLVQLLWRNHELKPILKKQQIIW